MKNQKTPSPLFGICISQKSMLFLSLFLIINLAVLHAQNSISGTVTDSRTSETIIGATVSIKGTKIATITNADGVYTLKAPGNSVIIVSYIGFESVEKEVKGNTTLNFILKEEQNLLKEVIVVGYGTQKSQSKFCNY